MENRVIKFRAWDKRQKCFQSWEFIKQLDNLGMILSGEHLIYEPLLFTGLLDKNKVEIYEGDIIKINCGGKIGHIFVSVVWNEFYGQWGTNAKMAGYYEGLRECLEDELNTEVVGNIYSTPELLNQ